MSKANVDPFAVSDPEPSQRAERKPPIRTAPTTRPQPVETQTFAPPAPSVYDAPTEPGEQEPPKNILAEEFLLSAILTNPDAYLHVQGHISADDFFTHRHQVLFAVCEKLFVAGQPVNPVSVATHLKNEQALEGIGGLDYLMELVTKSGSGHPDVVNDLARQVRSAAVVRRVITASYETIAEGYAGVLDPDEYLARSNGRLMSLSFQSRQKQPRRIGQAAQEAFSTMRDRAASKNFTAGLPTGIQTIDAITGGLRPSETIIIAARPSMGKAQPLDSKVLTPKGYRLMGDLAVGDEISGSDGEPTLVDAIYPQGQKQVYKITLSDGRSVECCNEHLWLVAHYSWVNPKIIDTKMMIDLIRHHSFKRKLKLPVMDKFTDVWRWLAIYDIAPSRVTECQCIRVTSADHLYVTDNEIITHNTATAMNIAMSAALAGKHTLFCSLEMSEAQLMNRAFCLLTKIEGRRIQGIQYLSREDWYNIGDAAGRMSDVPLWIDEQPAINLLDLKTKCLKMKQGGGLDLLMVDYLQLMSPLDKRVNREQQISGISSGLKALGKEFNIPVIALSQLSRKCEDRPGPDKRPQLSDLRESGSIEQDADIVMFLFRPEYYHKAKEPVPEEIRGLLEVIVAKNRNGGTGTALCSFDAPTMEVTARSEDN